ncbi:hypothetical protein SSX86_030215 [Deinandra increscens subsp. villosa]|uniref:ATP-dependent DNA helicase n=1 Tax=Deinandra increscens subsp. villosa TaxID=3103831 RepID=A0AAP0C648_9ASTR
MDMLILPIFIGILGDVQPQRNVDQNMPCGRLTIQRHESITSQGKPQTYCGLKIKDFTPGDHFVDLHGTFSRQPTDLVLDNDMVQRYRGPRMTQDGTALELAGVVFRPMTSSSSNVRRQISYPVAGFAGLASTQHKDISLGNGLAQPDVGLKIRPGQTAIELAGVTLDHRARVSLVGKEGIPESTHSIVTTPKRKRDAAGDNARPESSKQAFKRATRRRVADVSGSGVTSVPAGSASTVGGSEVVGSSHSKVTISRHDRQPDPSTPHLKKPTSGVAGPSSNTTKRKRPKTGSLRTFMVLTHNIAIKLHHQTGTVGPVLRECVKAVWRMLAFGIRYSYPSVMKLTFHLHGQNVVTLRDNENIGVAVHRPGIKETMFTEWFELNKVNANARRLTYAEVWEQNWETLCKDIVYKKWKFFRFPKLQLTPDQKKSYCLLEIQAILQRNGWSLDDFDDLSKPDLALLDGLDNHLIREDLSYDTLQEAATQQQLCNVLNNEQKLIYDHVIDFVQQQKGGFFFVYGPGGTSKTFLYRAILARVRSERMIALAVASSGR